MSTTNVLTAVRSANLDIFRLIGEELGGNIRRYIGADSRRVRTLSSNVARQLYVCP